MAQEMLLSNLVTETGALGTAQKIGGSSGGGGGGGGGVFVVEFTETGGVISANKTIAEIKAAFDSGKDIIGIYGNIYQIETVAASKASFYSVGYTSLNGGKSTIYLIDGISALGVDTWDTTTATISDDETVTSVTGTTPTITPSPNTIYNCGELTSLTISNPPATGKYTIIFYSGATATTTVGIENFVAEANKRYKITVEDNYATYDSWPYTPTP